MELARLAHPVAGVRHSLAQPHRGRAATAGGRALIARTQLQSPVQGTGRLPGEDSRSPTTRWSRWRSAWWAAGTVRWPVSAPRSPRAPRQLRPAVRGTQF